MTDTANNTPEISSISTSTTIDTTKDGNVVASVDSSTEYNPNIDNWKHPFLRSVFSDENGTGSSVRVGTLSIIYLTLGMVIYLVVKMGDIPVRLMSLGFFSSLLITVIYSPSKIADIFNKYFTRK